MRTQYLYLIEKIKDGKDWPKGIQIWADQPCPGWRVVKKKRIRSW